MKRKPSSLTTWNLSWTLTPTTSSARLGHHAGREGRLAVRSQELSGLAERLVVTRVVVLHRPDVPPTDGRFGGSYEGNNFQVFLLNPLVEPARPCPALFLPYEFTEVNFLLSLYIKRKSIRT